MPLTPPPPPPPNTPNDNSLYGKLKTYSSLWCRTPTAGAVTALTTTYLYPFARLTRLETPLVYPRPFPLPFFSAIFAFSSYMSYAGYGRDSAGVLSAWSMVYILMNVRGKNSKSGTMAVGRPGGGMRVFALGVMGWNAIAGTGVFLFGWGHGRGGGGWRMAMPEAEEATV
ncbi:hypothetical protein TWF506_004231 [Arthrobotrys conoides]|uniref:Altered inheritance of mitochondria protein 19 n=1 Tax=Arthrobotrys conoides TaxID=74498 RepID=A0AAN8N2D6_9PEZI